MIKAVIFDIGGPLDLETAFEAAIDADIREGLASEGFQITEEAWQAANESAVRTFAPNVYRAVIWQLTQAGIEASTRVYHRVQANGHTRDFFELRPDIVEVLDSLKARGLRLGLAGNQPAAALPRLARVGIGHYFENPGISGIYGFRKPDVRLFLRACQDLSVTPEECIMVGDRIDCDVVPAKLLGMRTVLIRTGRHAAQQPRSWDEVPDAETVDAEGILAALTQILDREQA